MGGVDKAALTLHGQRLVDRVIGAAREAGAQRVVVVGSDSAGATADTVVREEPAFGGPLAGIAAGLPHIRAPWVMVLPCDLQRPRAVATTLQRALPAARGDGVILVDQDGREQWLAGIYRTAALAQVCEGLADQVVNAPVRRALALLELHRQPITNRDSLDIDTPEALKQARANHGAHSEERTKNMATHLPPEALNEWLSAAADELGLDENEVDIATLLDVAKDVAHNVARPAAPLSTFLLGLALGRAAPGTELGALAEQLAARAKRWGAQEYVD